eukprot:GCRY01001535.1.p1 GENE.GCRY01001535.1~~GCRY01001535.1.p1  ORF type:complete len:328 (+),score=54.26 GCRY01001535.1:245-1228(+)
MFTLSRNLYRWIKRRREKRIRILLLGVDNAGKTTLLHALKEEDPELVTPTWGFNTEETKMREFIVTFFDLGGGENIRGIWTNYYAEVHGAIYVVDSADKQKIEAATSTFIQCMEDERLKKKPVLVLSNKQDLEGALDAVRLSETLGLTNLEDTRFHVTTCTAKTQIGSAVDSNIKKGIQWLLDAIKTNYNEIECKIEVEMAEQKEREKIEREEKRKRVEKLREERRRKAEEEQQRELQPVVEPPPPEESVINKSPQAVQEHVAVVVSDSPNGSPSSLPSLSVCSEAQSDLLLPEKTTEPENQGEIRLPNAVPSPMKPERKALIDHSE